MSGIPFVRDFSFAYGETARVSPLIRRLIANNPGPFTFTGTGVYIIGSGEVAVIDPGPDDSAHFDALRRALKDEKVTHVLVTHSHADHSPLAHPLAEWAGCQVHGAPAPPLHGHDVQMDAEDDAGFRPHVRLRDGDMIEGAGWTIETMATPGHASNHLCYVLREENALFSGDHVMGWSTTVISPPDGDMGDYFASLEAVRARRFATIWPTHGPPIRDVDPFLGAYLAHRRARETMILERLSAGSRSAGELVAEIYHDVDRRLHPAARQSVLAHLIHLEKERRVIRDGEAPASARYRLAH
jgi:glyoxylase-like metal-dependent hydrolase (beta-lactamase superfamily II)